MCLSQLLQSFDCTAAGSPQVIWHLNVSSCVLSPWAAWCLLTCGILWAESVNWSYASRFVCIYSNSSHSSLGEPSKWCRHTLVKPNHQSKKCDKVLENECSGVNEFSFTTFNNFDYVLEYSTLEHKEMDRLNEEILLQISQNKMSTVVLRTLRGFCLISWRTGLQNIFTHSCKSDTKVKEMYSSSVLISRYLWLNVSTMILNILTFV